ncbi:urea ABC transporter permease subunit UrtB [Paraglaciecola aquimarina]|uniref:Urea ABC transporter permease subunit UrtB n=1 Tax=Paraglaciecola aquimarina TaxID=1235557 RepID=A0ABU3SW61_9ALTE|nr:urea ABC transporter permease subunit UrtB [Paraglaciecola aquimarina]MDU0354147.1 urea ABC transporter permease subunit UrtB [Paraglaciecola aquimarina]
MLRTFMVLFSLLCFQASAEDNASQTVTSSSLSELAAQLPTTKLSKMAPLVEKIANTQSANTRVLLQYLLDGELYYVKANKAIVRAQLNEQKQYDLTDVLGTVEYSASSKSAIRKIRTNNRLRGQIRSLLAKLDLTDANPQVRIAALQQLIDKPNESAISTIQSLIGDEKDQDVAQLMQTIVDVQLLKTGNHEQKMAAIKGLKNSLEPAVNNMLVTQLAALPNKPKTEQDMALARSLQDAIDKIDSKRSFYGVVENIFFGLSLGSVLLLAAIGLAITFGVMGVINMAHGEMIMLGAYTTYVVQLIFPHLIEYSLFIAIPLAFLVSGSVGIIIERCVIRFLKGRPLETLLATFGISLILQQLVRTIFSPLNRQVSSPEWMSGSLQINPVFSLTYSRLYIIIFSLMVFFALLLILKKSSLGLHVRAVSQNRDMARALSIKSDWVDAITFGLGSGIAGVAGVVLSQLTNVGPNLGQAYIIDSFLVVVFGGVGNLWGTLVAAMSLGSINKFLEPITGSVLANIIVLVGLVLFIQKRPKGLFPQKGRSTD